MKKRKKWIIILIIIVLLVLCYIAFVKKNAEEKLDDETKDDLPEECEVVGNTSNYIKVTDEKNTSWTVTETMTNKTYTFTIEEKTGGLAGLSEGSYTLTKNSDEDKKEYHFVFDSFHHSYDLEPANQNHLNDDSGAFVALVLDKDEQPVEGITLNFYDADEKLEIQATTDKDGRIAVINMAPIEERVYYVEQDGVKSPKRKTFYLNKYDVKGIKFHVDENGIIE